LEIHLETVIERVWRCTWRPGLSEIGGALGGGQSGGSSWEEGATGADISFIGSHVFEVMYRIEYNMVRREMRDWLGARDSRSWDDAVCVVRSTECMRYLVCAVLGVYCTECVLYSWCMPYSVYAVLSVCCICGVCHTQCMVYSV
jgi:hypothetical protein